MQIITTMRYHLRTVRMPSLNKSTNNKNAGEGVEEKVPSFTVGGNVNWYNLCKILWRYLRKLNIELPYNPEIPLMDIYLDKTVI